MNKEILAAQMSKALRMYVDKAETTDEEALQVKLLYPQWIDHIGESVEVGRKFLYGDKLYKVRQAHTTQADWAPDKTDSLYTVIDEVHAGTKDDPIPAETNMQYYKDKYYIEGGKLYLCTRDTEQPVAYLPSELVGQYFTLV